MEKELPLVQRTKEVPPCNVRISVRLVSPRGIDRCIFDRSVAADVKAELDALLAIVGYVGQV